MYKRSVVKLLNVFRSESEWVHKGVPIHMLFMEGTVQMKCFRTRVNKQHYGR